ncbi:probable E3 ubiquitin-protein ligase RHG1A [Rutidosis leptorrhynchoides]|uniref:probable E3 ubiquitin-protein ligase RHG1A n=1 Tax=Rutidosis leptorrhynchoides TaxID=125765 RepID=UPI003A99BC4A
MQGQRGAIGSFQETLTFEHGSTSTDAVDQQIRWENNLENSPSNQLLDYISLDSPEQEDQNENIWNVGEPSSSAGPSQPDHEWPSMMKNCPEPTSSVLSLGDHGSSSSQSFSDPFGPSSDPFDLDDHQRLSRKRKAVELSIGQSSSGVGSSSGSSSWHTVSENGPFDPTIPRLGLSVNAAPSENHQENVHRNVNSRILSSHQRVADLLPANNNNRERELDISGPYTSLRLNLRGESSTSHQDQPVLRIPRRNFQSTSRWTRSSLRAVRSSNLVISEDRNELDSISDHPLFAAPSNTQNDVQNELNWTPPAANTTDGVTNGGGATSRSGTRSGVSSHYHPRRLSAYLRRTLSSAADSETGEGQTDDILPRIPQIFGTSSSSSSSQDISVPPAIGIQGHHHQSHSRSSLLLGRHLDGALRFPHLSRSATPGNEGRGRLVSEIRNVLDLMRRGEPMRFEDLMLLDQSVFYGIADIHDRHRDMRLDIDNMSYEELLALEERIGNVNTGLTEETILKHLKLKQYVPEIDRAAEPCCICQEEYKDGDDLGTLECGHDFHCSCVKQWLQHKNSCPICKSTGFANT